MSRSRGFGLKEQVNPGQNDCVNTQLILFDNRDFQERCWSPDMVKVHISLLSRKDNRGAVVQEATNEVGSDTRLND